MNTRHTAPTWPMEATTLPEPRVRQTLTTAAALAIGCCCAAAIALWPVVRAGGLAKAWPDEVPLLIGAGAFALGALLALAAFAWIAVGAWRNGPVWHAAAGVLADVPSEPVSAAESLFALSPRARYGLELTDVGWWFGPKPGASRASRRLGIPLISIVAAAALIVVWGREDLTRTGKIFGTVGVMFAWDIVCAVLWFRFRPVEALPFVILDERRRICEIGPEPVSVIPFDRVVAVQLCACRRKHYDSISDGIEANLVCLGDDSEPPDDLLYLRTPLMFFTSDVGRKGRLAGQLAEQLGVPLLCHATREHWRSQREEPMNHVPNPTTKTADSTKPNA